MQHKETHFAHPLLLLLDYEFVVARDEELRSASLIPLEIHVLIVCFKVPEGQTGDSLSVGGRCRESPGRECGWPKKESR